MEKQISRTNVIETGMLKNFGGILFDFDSKKITMGMTFNENTFTGECSFVDALDGVTVSQKNVIKGFFKKVKRICLNDGINPDTPIVNSDITEDLE